MIQQLHILFHLVVVFQPLYSTNSDNTSCQHCVTSQEFFELRARKLTVMSHDLCKGYVAMKCEE